jgi:tRNA pseudouridine55 synthase
MSSGSGFSGLALIDKPQGWTSHDVVAKLRGIAGTRRVGHAGTLDPMATGLLLIGINSATKLLTFLVGENKTYTATIRLGASTITDDKESEYLQVAEPAAVDAIDQAKIEVALDSVRGEIMQVPSSVSAIKVDGQRAYAKVRSGDGVKLAARPITIHKFEITAPITRVTEAGIDFIDIEVLVECSSGTYIRALARDLGESLGVGGHLVALRRTKVGAYLVEQAQQLEGLTRENLRVMPISAAAQAQFAVRTLSEQEVIDLRHGKRLKAQGESSEPVAGIDANGNLVAMLTVSKDAVKSLVVFNDAEQK